MMILSTLATGALILTHPMQPPEPEASTRIYLSCNLIVIKGADGVLERGLALDENERSGFTISGLQKAGAEVFSGTRILDIGDGRVEFRPGDGEHPVDLSASHGRASLIARPQILALDGQEATINIGTEVTFIQTIKSSDDEGFHQVKFAKRFEGFELSFVGFDGGGGVRLDPLRIKISGISGHRAMPVGEGMSIDSPIFTERELTSSLVLAPDALAVIPIGPMPDDSGYLIATISARAIHPSVTGQGSNSPGNP